MSLRTFKVGVISIHAPRVGGDLQPVALPFEKLIISIHAPRVGGDQLFLQLIYAVQKFQSTPPVWGATCCGCPPTLIPGISIHAPRVGGDAYHAVNPQLFVISIHAPRVGGDLYNHDYTTNLRISIHAPRVGGDVVKVPMDQKTEISIHAPRVGGDNGNCSLRWCMMRFQSTPPVWGATRGGPEPL